MEVISTLQILKMIAAMVFVLALMGLLGFVMKRMNLSDNLSGLKRSKRLKVVESLNLDNKRKIALIQCDDKQHLVLMGINGDTIIQTDIEPKDDDESATQKKSPTL